MKIELEELIFNRDEIPVKKRFDIDGTDYAVEIKYNSVGDFYTLYLYDSDDNLLFANILLHMRNVFDIKRDNFPFKRIIPLNIDSLERDEAYQGELNFETFGNKIRIYIV